MDLTETYSQSQLRVPMSPNWLALVFCSYSNTELHRTTFIHFKFQLSVIAKNSLPLPSQLSFFPRRSIYGRMSVRGMNGVKRIYLPGNTGPYLSCVGPFCFLSVSDITTLNLCLLVSGNSYRPSRLWHRFTDRIMQYQILAALVPTGILSEQALEAFRRPNTLFLVRRNRMTFPR
ncbi:hypothetical protein DL98DRAFT_58525 [Cadophora sp. DSE1049]|nr:hypothetical protein DL98DRAFT_58525 [Cadophora sp. DSE1049]